MQKEVRQMNKKEKQGKKPKREKKPRQEKKGFQFADWDYDMVDESIPNLPASWVGFWAWRIRRMFLGLKLDKATLLTLLKALLAFVAISVASYYFNIFFWAWINDSMWIGWGKGYAANLSPEQRKTYDKLVDDFNAKAEPLRDQMFIKRAELRALENSTNASKAEVDKTAREFLDLRNQMRDLHDKLVQDMEKAGLYR